MAEASTAVIIVQTVGVAVGVVAAIGIIAYGIYKANKYLTHSYEKKSDDGGDGGNPPSPTDYGEIKRKTQDSTVRQRNVKKEEDIQNERNESKSVTKTDTSNEPPKKKEQCHIEVQTDFEQGTQTGTSVFQNFTLPMYENRALSDDIASVSSSTTFDGTLSTCDSLASTETVTPDMDQDLLGARIPTWNEMSDADRALCLCPSCDNEVSTITIPCQHPYLCDECAPIMRKFYSRCPLCRKRITGYQSI